MPSPGSIRSRDSTCCSTRYAIVAAAKRPDLHLVVVGSPVLGQDAYAADLRARVAATPGAQLLESRDDIPDVMADLDVLAFPSVEPESYGLVLVEALASGTPVVATDHGGPPEIVARATPGTATVVPPGDADALATALLDLLPQQTSSVRRRAAPAWLHTPAREVRRALPLARRRSGRALDPAVARRARGTPASRPTSRAARSPWRAARASCAATW